MNPMHKHHLGVFGPLVAAVAIFMGSAVNLLTTASAATIKNDSTSVIAVAKGQGHPVPIFHGSGASKTSGEELRNSVASLVAQELQANKVGDEVLTRVVAIARNGKLYGRAATAAGNADLGVAARQKEWESRDHTVIANTPRAYALDLVLQRTWGLDQWACIDRLWFLESNWNYLSGNKSSGAYGIPQALPADKMASEGADWRTNPKTQIRWGIRYIERRYGNPCGALDFWSSNNWY